MFNYEKHIVKQRLSMKHLGFPVLTSSAVEEFIFLFNHTVKLKGPELIIKPDFFL